MITVIAKLTAAEGKSDEMRAALETMVAGVDANEPGVLAYSLHTVDDDPNVFYFYEQYESAGRPTDRRTTWALSERRSATSRAPARRSPAARRSRA